MTLREKRSRDIANTITRTITQRDGCLSNLIRYEARLKSLRRQAQRLERAMAAPQKAAAEPKLQQPAVQPYQPNASLASKIDDIMTAGGDLAIPTFLQRTKDADRKDAEAAAALKQEIDDRKKSKARARSETMKAKQRGDTRRMPLTGKAALEAIRQS